MAVIPQNLRREKISPSYRVHVHQPEARELLGSHFKELLKGSTPGTAPGHPLYRYRPFHRRQPRAPDWHQVASGRFPVLQVYGTLEKPVHAVNLEETTGEIYRRFHRPYIVAVDACLGKAESIGYITMKLGPLQPGTGVNKTLPAVGNLHVVGVVNVGGFMEYLVLQNTRLSLVIQMAEVISDGLLQGCRLFFPGQRPAMVENKAGLTPVLSE